MVGSPDTLRPINFETLVGTYSENRRDIRVEIATGSDQVGLEPGLICSTPTGQARVLFGRSVAHLAGTEVYPDEFGKLFVHGDPGRAKEIGDLLVGADKFDEPLVARFRSLSGRGRVRWQVWGGASSMQAQVLSEIGSRENNTIKELGQYQTAYSDVYELVARQPIEKIREPDPKFANDPGLNSRDLVVVVGEDCAASFVTDGGFLLVSEKLRVPIRGFVNENLTATAQAMILLTQELLGRGIYADLRVGFVGFGLTNGDASGEGRNYIARTDRVLISGKNVVGDIGERSDYVDGLSFSSWRPGYKEYPKINGDESTVMIGFPRGDAIPTAKIQLMRSEQRRELLHVGRVEAKRITGFLDGREEFGVMFGDISDLRKLARA